MAARHAASSTGPLSGTLRPCARKPKKKTGRAQAAVAKLDLLRHGQVLLARCVRYPGDYERFFEEDGVRYHHIINPKTGKSATGVRSVTVIGPDGVTTEGLTKSVFVKGPKEGMRLIESLKGVDAIVIDDAGRMLYSPGLRNAVREEPVLTPPNSESVR